MTRIKFFSLLTLCVCWLTLAPSTAASQVIHVYYKGPQDGVIQALSLSKALELVETPDSADVIVLNGEISEAENIHNLVGKGKGLVLILGPRLTPEQLNVLLGDQGKFGFESEPLSLNTAPQINDPLLREVAWNSAPQVRERLRISVKHMIPLVVGYQEDIPILSKGMIRAGQIFVFTPFLGKDNLQFQDWAYFNYFIYHLTVRAAGIDPATFADYPDSPVPHGQDRVILVLSMAGFVIVAAFAFLFVRRYSLSHPEALNDLVIDRQDFDTRQASTDWEEIGFHRPLGGFLFAFMLGLVMFVPLIIYQNLILPGYILPSAQALGIWGRVVQFFQLIWLVFDIGTSSAFIKFFSQYRVLEPRQAIKYGQVFVWWQALSGSFQVALVTILAGIFLPRTTYALYTWSIIIHTLIQVPGFYQVFRHALTALQRFDYAQMLDLGLALVFPILTQPIIVTLMVLWGKSHPAFGVPMAGVIGLGLAAYVAEALTFIFGFWLYRRLGYNSRLLFLAHFDWSTVKQAFRFGVFEMLASAAWGIGQSVEILITQNRLVNYAEVWGNWTIAQNFIFAYQVLQTLFSNLMPSISEAISHGRKFLSQYYAALAYKWGAVISAFIGAVLLAVADRFILGATGSEFTRAAVFAIPLIVWGAIQYPSWVGDNVQLASNRPYLMSLLVAGEQSIRILLALILVERFQINGLIAAYFVGLLSKDFLAYLINHRLCFPQRFYFWQSFAAPVFAGAVHYGFLRWFTALIWKGDQITSVLIFFIGILLSYPLFAFLYGLFGGWDEGTLKDLQRAVDLSNFMRPLSLIFWRATSLGASLSPLNDRFPIEIRQAALLEARGLTEERVEI